MTKTNLRWGVISTITEFISDPDGVKMHQSTNVIPCKNRSDAQHVCDTLDNHERKADVVLLFSLRQHADVNFIIPIGYLDELQNEIRQHKPETKAPGPVETW